MAEIPLPSLTELDADQVAQLQDTFAQLVAEKYPELYLKRGVFHDLLAYFVGGVGGAWVQAAIDRLLRSGSLAEIENDPTLADDELVDRLLANFQITRRTGTTASGEIVLRLDSDRSLLVPAGTRFSANGLWFITQESYALLPSDSVAATETQRVLVPLADGTYQASIPVVAEEAGSQYNVIKGTTFVPEVPLDGVISAYAAADFAGGKATESNEELIARLKSGLTAKVPAGRAHIEAMLKAEDDFSDLIAVSTIGFGNAEMVRSGHSLLFPSGSTVDIYVRTSALPNVVEVDLEAVYVGDQDGYTVWQFSVDKDTAPGFYDCIHVRPTNQPADVGSFQILSVERGFDLSSSQTLLLPDVMFAYEAAFSPFQTATVRFVDSTKPTGSVILGTTDTYTVQLSAIPKVDAIHNFMAHPDNRMLGCDVLVKAAVPCFLSVRADIYAPAGTATPDTDEIGVALADFVNATGFRGKLSVSELHSAIHDKLQSGQAVAGMTLLGVILFPDGERRVITSNDILEVPDEPARMVSGNTVCFYLDPADVGIAVSASDVPLL